MAINTKEEFLETFASIDGTTIVFTMPVDSMELFENSDGIEFLNNQVDEFVEDGYKFQGLSYEPIGVDATSIIIQVTADGTDFLEEEEEEEEEVDDDLFCPNSDTDTHEPDWNTISLANDGERFFVDVNCKNCGHSGCVATGTFSDLQGVNW